MQQVMVQPGKYTPSHTPKEIQEEWIKCTLSPIYFVNTYVKIYDVTAGDWIPFSLWPEQATTLKHIHENQLCVILKARQLGLTWLVLGYGLWLMLFRAAATILLFSRRDDEAVHLLDFRMKGMYQRLPPFLKTDRLKTDNDHEWVLGNDSTAYAFPTTAGDSYTATFAMVDEADLVPDLNRLLRAVKPTIDTGGKMVLLSRSDKTNPNSEFKRIYLAGKAHKNPWKSVFLPWYIRRERTAEWYASQKADALSRSASLDDLYEQYPASDIEALAPASKDKRLPSQWVMEAFTDVAAYTLEELPDGVPTRQEVLLYHKAEPMGRYVIGADPAEGNPTSDPSSITVLDRRIGEEVMFLSGQFEVSTFSALIDQVAMYYNRADILVERNNHGHAVIMWLKEHSRCRLLLGWDKKSGWYNTQKGLAQLYDNFADGLKQQRVELHSPLLKGQLLMIEGNTLHAPELVHDDAAMSCVLAYQAMQSRSNGRTMVY